MTIKFKTILGFVLLAAAVFFSSHAFANIEILDADVSGRINQTGSYSQVDGNKNFSFVDSGAHYNTDIVTQARSKLLKEDWKWDFDARVRKTDDNEVDQRTSVHLLQLTTRVYNPNSQFQFGDFYTRFTDLTFNRAVEGFNYQANYKKVGTRINAVAGRQYRGLDYIQNSRYVWGGHVDQDIITKKFLLINNLTVGSSFAQTFDDPHSIGQHFGVPQMNNVLGSINTHVRAIEDLNVDVELGKSVTNDRANILQMGDTLGYAFSLKTDYKKRTQLGNSYLKFDYERIESGYQALSGSALPDREAYYGSFTQRFNPRWTANATLRTIRNNLEDTSFTTNRTWNPRFSLFVTPIEKMQDFVVTPYLDFREQKTTNGTVDVGTVMAGVNATKKIWYDIMLNGGYDMRRRIDDAGMSDEIMNDWRLGVSYNWIADNIRLSPYFNWDYRRDYYEDVPNRTSFKDYQWGVTGEFYKRLRVYFNYGLSYDDRSFQNTDTDRYLWNLSAEYDITSKLMFVIGWRQYVQHFQREVNDYGENVGSIRLQYKY
ncbi:MAG: hypothetical protein HZC17_01925 [Candidatus Omnitrophica bacterium]|nr:hypothetical protein [Candidatus Omnitrophota bacterium]